MAQRSIPRLDKLGLPDDIVSIARANHELPPTAQERVMEAIAHYHAELEDLQASRISTFDWLPEDMFVRKDLRRQIEEVQWRRDMCRGLVGSLRKVPAEVLSEIFLMCLASRTRHAIVDEEHAGSRIRVLQDEEEKEKDDDDERTRMSLPGDLSLVSRSWRAVCLATPALWSVIIVDLAGYFSEHDARWRPFPKEVGPLVRAVHLDGLIQRIEMVSSYPWSLRINGRKFWRPFSIPLHEQFIPYGAKPLTQVLANQRETSCVARLSVDGVGKSNLGMKGLNLPQVKSAVIRCFQESYEKEQEIPNTPVLEMAVFDYVLSSRRIPSQETVPWRNLTHLFLLPITHRQWKAIIRLCFRLKKGAFRMRYWNDDELHWLPPLESVVDYEETTGEVVLDDLQELTFFDVSPFSEEEVRMRDIACPRLNRLEMFVKDASVLWDFDAASRIVQNLTHLSLRFRGGGAESGDVLARILETAPKLETAFLTVGDRIEDLMDYLTYGAASPYSAERYRLRYLKDLGLEVVIYEWAAERGDEELVNAFPYQHFRSFLASRTQFLVRTDRRETSSLAQLERIAIHVNEVYREVPEIRTELREIFAPPVNSCGLRVDFSSKSRERVVYPVKHLWRHWDDGLVDFVEEAAENGLHLKE